MKAVNLTTQRELAGNLTVAGTVLSRMKGLLGKNSLPVGDGLWIRPCKGIHTFGMKFPIDVVFLDRERRVVAAVGSLCPHRLSRLYFTADSVLELPTGSIEKSATVTGDCIDFI